MEEIQYIGEHLLPGKIGHLSLVLSFITGLIATIAYFFATQRRDRDEFPTWRNMGRISFFLHGAGIFTVIGMMFYIMVNQYYEYQYVQAHVSEDLPFKYIFSAFWEGQEGSFLLWMFWHIILGFVLIWRSGKWEMPVMASLSLIQVFITSMILGIYIGFGDDPMRIGSNPLLLLRDVMDAPIFANADYTSLIKGKGLNPLLQNYWMTIHPPTLFLGFASTAIPFCFAVAGLWTGEHKAWLKPAMPWALFSGAILGIGILMGGAWAYEALSFGGYWAWDPVENLSLVPWLTLVAGIHTNLIAKNTNQSIRSTYIFYLLTFLLIVYSTFMTRSGILGETSVHAFTEMGLETQLILFIVIFLGISLFLLIRNYKRIPSPEKEEPLASKEFWMFIGTLVLLFSALIITASTSLPVYNKIRQFFDPTFEGNVITDPEPHYNRYQLWIAVFMGILSAVAQHLRFKEVNWKGHLKKFGLHIGVSVGIALLLTFLVSQWIDLVAWQYGLMLFAGLFTLVANLDSLFSYFRGKIKVAGSSFSHMGFGLMILGIVASSLNKNVISTNPFIMEGLIEGADEESLRNNILLFKNSPIMMGNYEVTYAKDTIDLYTRTYQVNYKRKNAKGEVTETFDLYPNILYDKSFTKIAASNPSTKRYLGRDIFTHIASLPQVEMDMEYRQEQEEKLDYKRFDVAEMDMYLFRDTVELEDQDTFVLKEYTIKVDRINRQPTHPEYTPQAGDMAVGVQVKVMRSDVEEVYEVEPMLLYRDQLLYSYPVQINELSAKVRLNEAIFANIFTPEEELDYQEFTLKQGDEITYNGQKVRFAGFNKEPDHPNYAKEEGDIAVSAVIEVNNTYRAQPVYFIRNANQFNLKDEVEELGLHFRFTGINPAEESINLFVAYKEKEEAKIPVEIATNSLRSDYIVLEAIEFPGINFFWLGSVLMMFGLGLSMWNRMMQLKS